ncbi:MAG: DHH family phosphoesterase [Euryarchaeota archaeon]|nr:DHH family phosphoesterase [Euryarchaeota archaeon]
MRTLHEAAHEAAERVRALPRNARVRVVAHYDADGVSAAAVVVGALRRLAFDFHVTYTYEHDPKYYEGLAHDAYEANIFVDLGAGVAATIAKLPGLNLVLDHHQAPAPPSQRNLVVVNAHHLGLDGTRDACGSTTSFAFAVALDEANWAFAPQALVGAWGDRQARGALEGWNAKVLEEGLKRGVLTGPVRLAAEDAPLEAFVRAAPPPWRDAFADVGDPAAFLASHGLPPRATVHELGAADSEVLASLVVSRLLARGFPAYRVRELFHPLPHSPTHDLPVPRMAQLLSAATREHEAGLGLAFLLGDPHARGELETIEARYNEKIHTALSALRPEHVRRMRGIQVFQTHEPAYTGELCGLAMSSVLPSTHATIAYSIVGPLARVSSRGTPGLVERGLDLAKALSAAAADHSGHGGGHAIASGATVPATRLDAFLADVDAAVARQLGAT